MNSNSSNYDLIVIGAGPAGYVASIRASQLGMKVLCVEKEKTLGGTCLNIGCIPSKALLDSTEKYYDIKTEYSHHGITADALSLDMNKMQQRKEAVVRRLTLGVASLFKKNKIDYVMAEASLLPDGTVKAGQQIYQAPKVLIATGSEPTELPLLSVDGVTLLNSTHALSLREVPSSLVVIGAGAIGLELGSVFARLGTEVTVVELAEELLLGSDREAVAVLQKSLQKLGMKFLFGHKVVSCHQAEKVTLNLAGSTSMLQAEKVLVAVGRRPSTKMFQGLGLEMGPTGTIKVDEKFATSRAGIYAIGDVIAGPMLAHKAMHEAVACVEMMAGLQRKMTHNIPHVIYTNPELAAVGLTMEEAQQRGMKAREFKVPFLANGRSLASGNKEGFVKLLASESGQVLGAHMVGPHVSELLPEIILAMEMKATVEDIALTIHSHPSLSEAVHEAALGLSFGAIHT